MYRRYYSYSDMPQLVKKDLPEEKPCSEPSKECAPCSAGNVPAKQDGGKLFGKFQTDDIILGIIILALLMDDGDDSLLLIALAIIFLTGII
ncbi:MAG: hypothetical protein PUE13_00650 [Clostridiales bacterium]|nr:hypothetical protein [Clostridiales bacterium]